VLICRPVVTLEASTVLHQLDGGPAGQVSCATLRAVVHHIHLDCRFATGITHYQCRVYWIEISIDRLETWCVSVIKWSVTGQNLLIAPLDHSHGIAIGPVLALGVKSVKELPVHGDIFTLEIINENRVE